MSDANKLNQDEPFYAGRTRILEIAASGAPLPEILRNIVPLMEAEANGIRRWTRRDLFSPS
jgi:hypothetical protein